MAFVFELPEVGEGVVEAEVVSWNVAVGDVVELLEDMESAGALSASTARRWGESPTPVRVPGLECR